MPFKSMKQMKWMFAEKPEMAKEWVGKYGSFKSKDSKPKKTSKYESMIKNRMVMHEEMEKE